MSPSAAPEAISDYNGFDFRSLWPGRETVTEVERRLLRIALSSADRRRFLEVGTGFGRLLPSLEAMGDEVVAMDYDLGSLTLLRPSNGRSSPTLRVAANVYHLPFVDGAFTAAVMVRVYHHLSDPGLVMSELRRVLHPGARLLVSYNPRPTVGTIVNDIQRAIRPRDDVPFRSTTFAREPHLELPPDPFPVFIGPRPEFDRVVREAGFERQTELVSGLEEYSPVRHLPIEWFVRIATTFGRAPGFPLRFALLSAPAGSSPPLPRDSEILACPRCHLGLRPDVGEAGARCARCSFFGPRKDGVLDLRFVPEGTARWRGDSKDG